MRGPARCLAEQPKVKRLRESASWRRPPCFVQHRAGHWEQDGEQGQGQGPPARAPRWGQGGHLQCHTGERGQRAHQIHPQFRPWRISSWCPTLALAIVSSKGFYWMPQRGGKPRCNVSFCLFHHFSVDLLPAIKLWIALVSFVLSSG